MRPGIDWIQLNGALREFERRLCRAEIAEQAGHLKARYAKRGKALSVQDATIAAVSIAYSCALVTRNIRDFPMPELELYPLPKAA